MFPLGSVLLPTMGLPLRVFEPRYRALVEHCLESDTPEFGVVLIARGSEVGGGDVRNSIGCVASMIEVGRSPDGRYSVMSVGISRFEVIEWLDEVTYPRALVEDIEDPQTDPEAPTRIDGCTVRELHETNVVLMRRCLAIMSELGRMVPPATAELSEDVATAIYQCCVLAPLGPADKYRLLCAPSAIARAELLHDLLADQRAVLQFELGDLGGGPGELDPNDE